MSPETSVASCFCYEIAIGQQIPMMSQAGFTHVSLSVRSEHSGLLSQEERRTLKSLLRDNGMAVDTVHAPSLDAETAEGLVEVLRAAHELDARCMVAHAGPFNCGREKAADRWDRIRKNCSTIVKEAESLDIVLAVENVFPGPATDLAVGLLKECDSRCLGFCYDSSHDQINGPRQSDLLRQVASRLVAVHLSDRIKEFVDHVIPGEGFIDWPAMNQTLRQARYDKPILMEVMMQHSSYKNPKEFLQAAHAAAVDIWNAIHD